MPAASEPLPPEVPSDVPPDGVPRSLLWSGPAAPARALGTRLRHFRDQADLTLAEVAPRIRASVSKLSRLERGENKPSERDVRDLVAIYGIRDPEELRTVDVLLQRVLLGPSAEYADITPGWFRRLIDMEQEARHIEYWEGVVVPGPLQTERYARSIIEAGLPGASAEIVNRSVELRGLRGKLVQGRSVLAMLDESVLRRNIGGPEVMVEQLEWLHELASGDSAVQVRILPFSTPLTPPPFSFTWLTFGLAGPADVMYVEHPSTGATYLSKDEDVARLRHILVDLRNHVAEFRESLALIDRAIAKHRSRLASGGSSAHSGDAPEGGQLHQS